MREALKEIYNQVDDLLTEVYDMEDFELRSELVPVLEELLDNVQVALIALPKM